jgi:hypothetical protein
MPPRGRDRSSDGPLDQRTILFAPASCRLRTMSKCFAEGIGPRRRPITLPLPKRSPPPHNNADGCGIRQSYDERVNIAPFECRRRPEALSDPDPGY